jgi:hypothetical protein
VDELTANREAGCKDQQVRLDTILAKGSEGTGVDDLTAFSKTVTCDRLGPVVVAALDRFNIEAAKRAAILPNSPQLVTLAQTELVRLGCLTGKPDGRLSDMTKGRAWPLFHDRRPADRARQDQRDPDTGGRAHKA